MNFILLHSAKAIALSRFRLIGKIHSKFLNGRHKLIAAARLNAYNKLVLLTKLSVSKMSVFLIQNTFRIQINKNKNYSILNPNSMDLFQLIKTSYKTKKKIIEKYCA